MDVEQIRRNLKRLVDGKSVLDARLLFGGYEANNLAFINLTLALPSAAGREDELTRLAREAAGSPTIRVIVEYVAGGNADGRPS
jgi:hypothetical protein